LSEVLTEVSDTKEAFYQPGEHESPSAESIESRLAELDRVLTPLVSANSEVIVRCPWLGNDEVTLSEAMKAFPRPMIEEDPYTLAGIVTELLANPVNPAEEQEDSDPKEAEDESVRQETSDDKENGEPGKKAARYSDVKPKETAKVKSRTEPAKSKTAVEPQPKIENRPVDSPDIQLEIFPKPHEVKPAPPEAQKQAGHTQTSKPEAALNIPRRAEPLGFTDEVVENLALAPDVEKGFTPQEIAEPLQPSLPDTESTEPETVVHYEDPEFEPKYQFIDDSLEDLVEEEEVLPHATLETGFEPEEQAFEVAAEFEDSPEMEKAELPPQQDNALHQPEEIEASGTEQFDKTDEIKDILTSLPRYIELAGPETAEAVNAVLDRIDEISAGLEIDESGELINEAGIREELEKLFTDLFDHLGIEYSPGLIETLVYRTINEYQAGWTEEPADEGAAQDSGTNEAIKKLLAGSNSIRRAMSQALVIGKSALTLYSNRVLVEEYLTR
jgi:hypothetical protein